MEQIYLPKLSKLNKFIIIVASVLFVLNTVSSQFLQFSLTNIFGLSLIGIGNWKFFQFSTYPLIGQGVFEVVLNSLMLWLMGSEFELNWGIRRYSWFLLFVVLVQLI